MKYMHMLRNLVEDFVSSFSTMIVLTLIGLQSGILFHGGPFLFLGIVLYGIRKLHNIKDKEQVRE